MVYTVYCVSLSSRKKMFQNVPAFSSFSMVVFKLTFRNGKEKFIKLNWASFQMKMKILKLTQLYNESSLSRHMLSLWIVSISYI